MRGFNMTETRLRKMMRGVSCVVTLCGVFAMLVFVTGCPFAPVTTPTCTDDDVSMCTGGDPCTEATCNEGVCEYTSLCDATIGEECINDECVIVCTDENAAEVCDDANSCTDDACVDGACENTAVDCDDGNACTTDTCDADTGECVNVDETDCDDGEFCNGVEVCNTTTGECDAGTDPCVEGETCDEDNDECVVECDDAGDCDDGDLCTDDACVNGLCENTDVDCDDGDLCTTDSCDADTGDCLNEEVVCDEGQSCDEETGECVDDAVTACLDDEGNPDDTMCDDGIYCNGAETCNDEGECVAGDRPCDDGGVDGVDACDVEGTVEYCEEGDASATCLACPTEEIDFTLNTDNLTGTTGDDEFFAPTAFDSGTFNTFQTGDQANGLAGDDTLAIFFSEASGTTVPGTLSGIETLYVTDNSTGGVETLNLTNSSDIEAIYNSNSTQTVTIQSMPNIPMIGIVGSDTGFYLDTEAAATNGTADEITISVDDAEAGTVTLDTNNGTNGYETVTINPTGDVDCTLAALTETNGNSIKTVNFGGSAKLTITAALDATVDSLTTVNATNSSGGIWLTFGDALNLTVTGGSGDDLFDFGTTFTTSSTAKDTVVGGDGTDILAVEMNTSQTTAASVTGVETLRIEGDDDGNGETFTLGMAGTEFVTIELESQGTALTADTITLSQIPYPSTTPTIRLRGDGNDANQLFDGLTCTFSGATGTADHELNITFDNRENENPSGTALTRVDGTTERTVTVNSLGIDNIEDVNITNTKGNLTITTFDASNLDNLVITSGGNVTLGTIDSTTVDFIDLSGCTEDTSINVGSSTTAITYTGGTKDNTITTGTGTDTITTGAGDDTIVAGDGVDTITCGAGDDTVTTDAAGTTADADTVALGTGDDILLVYGINDASANADVVTGFTGGANNDVLRFDYSELETASAVDNGVTMNIVQFGGTDITGATAVDMVECSGACDVATATANIIVITGADIASTALLQTALEVGGSRVLTVGNTDTDTSDAFIVIYDDGTDAFAAMCYADTETAADTDYEAGDLTCFNLVELDGFGDIAASSFDATNFDWTP